jgi:2-C-methyl-D-erythritol 4-phosphate cytidylyltransferase
MALSKDATHVMVHDAARPLIDADDVGALVSALIKYQAAVLAVPAISTIKEVHPKTQCVAQTLDRSRLWLIQTPQAFKLSLLSKAHQIKDAHLATDDAQLVEKLGQKIKVVAGKYQNIKITTPEDLVVAKALLSLRKKR